MEIIQLNEDNVEEYSEYLTEDIAENIGRTFYHGVILLQEDAPVAGMVWEIRNMTEESATESNIVFLRVDEEEAQELLFQEYEEQIRIDQVSRSTVSLPAKTSKKEKQILQDHGFTVGLMEGDDIFATLQEIADIKAFEKIRISDSIRSLKSMSQREFVDAIEEMAEKGRFGICRDLTYLPRLYFENDISCFAEGEDKIGGILLLHGLPSGGLKVMLMVTVGKENTILLPQMIKKAVEAAMEEYAPETRVIIDRHNYATLALSEKLFPRGFGIPVYSGERAER